MITVIIFPFFTYSESGSDNYIENENSIAISDLAIQDSNQVPQNLVIPDSLKEEVSKVIPDNLNQEEEDLLLEQIDTLEIANPNRFKKIPTDKPVGDLLKSKNMTKSPTSAIYWSIIPGGGQYYNEDYLKSGLFLTSASVLTGLIIYNYSKFNPLQDRYDSLEETLSNMQTSDPEYVNLQAEQSSVLRRKEVFRDNAHLSIFFLGMSYFIATMDAYVGAHLYDFDVDDEPIGSLRVAPNNFMGLSLRYSYIVNK